MSARVVHMFGADFALRWPPEVFVDEIAELVRLGGGVRDWEARVGFALEDAFAGPMGTSRLLALNHPPTMNQVCIGKPAGRR